MDSIQELIAAIKGLTLNELVLSDAEKDRVVDAAIHAFPALLSMQSIMAAPQQVIREALERLRKKVNPGNDCVDCWANGNTEEKTQYCLNICCYRKVQLDGFAALLTAELMPVQPTEENPIKPIATIELKPLGEIRRGTIKELESEQPKDGDLDFRLVAV